MKKLLIIDTFNFLHRAYHALPPTFKDANGEPTNAVYGVTSMLINVLDQLKPTHVVAALDGEKPTFRLEDFTAYKGHRAPMDDALQTQIPKVFEILDAFGIKKIVVEGYEADDVIGTLAKNFGKDDMQVVIVSNDRDIWQLVNANVSVMMPTTKGDADWIGPREVQARMGLTPAQVIDYKGLKGDASDNIPGVFGIGEKTAQKLVAEYGSVEGIYKHISKVTPDSLREKLANCAEQAAMSKKLATIITNVPFAVSIDECKYHEFNKVGVSEVLKRYNFKSLIRRLGVEVEGDSDNIGRGRKARKENISVDQLPLL